MTPVETTPSTTTESSAATTPQTSEFGSFLGVEADSLPSLQPRESSAPGGAESESQSSEEAGAQTESTETTGDSTAETELATTETTEEEIADDWLPTEQEKEFPLEVLERYAPRYGYTAEEIAADPRLQQVLKDKLNSDIYIRGLQEQTDNSLLEETTTEGTEQTADPAAAATADPRAEYYKRVDALTQKFDSKVTEELGNKLLTAFGVNTDVKKLEQMLADPKLDANTRAEVQGAIALARNAGQIGSTLARGAVDLVLTAMPEILPQVLEAVAPGMLSSYQQYQDRNIAASVWSEVSQSRDGRGQPLYPKLPAYGTPEFREMTHKAEKELGLPQGEFGEMARKGFGRQAYIMIARHASGQRVTTQDVTRAVNTGRQQERVQQQRRATGRALGAGQQSRQFGQEETTDPVRDALRAQIQAQNSDADPFKGATARN